MLQRLSPFLQLFSQVWFWQLAEDSEHVSDQPNLFVDKLPNFCVVRNGETKAIYDMDDVGDDMIEVMQGRSCGKFAHVFGPSSKVARFKHEVQKGTVVGGELSVRKEI